MKKTLLSFLVILFFYDNLDAQFGIKAGYNYVNVTGTGGINAGNRSGFMIGAMFGPRARKLIGFRSEILLSRQGYDYKSGTNTGNVNLDYLVLPQLLTINFTKRIEIHAGAQLAYLLNAGVDSTGNNSSGSLFDYFNRFDYGLAGGFQLSPFSGLFIGGRINISLANFNKEQPIGSPSPSFIPKADLRNNVVQLYAGWRF
ncbi:MAG TPA: porin family protein [Chitinophagaceae bacterium]|nr:porin family protein [Chitinophagaceae bacterium]